MYVYYSIVKQKIKTQKTKHSEADFIIEKNMNDDKNDDGVDQLHYCTSSRMHMYSIEDCTSTYITFKAPS